MSRNSLLLCAITICVVLFIGSSIDSADAEAPKTDEVFLNIGADYHFWLDQGDGTIQRLTVVGHPRGNWVPVRDRDKKGDSITAWINLDRVSRISVRSQDQ